MKKIVVLLAAMSLFAVPAFAAISGTAHDLSTASTASDEICVFCHTPHGALAVGFAPLWNRTTADATAIYTGNGSLDSTLDLASVNATDAPLCLSCHDGSSLATGLLNPPNSAPAAGTAGDFAAGTLGANATLGTDLSNDHPVGFNYATTAGLDAEIRTQAVASAAGIPFYGAGSDMWCSSCHDVHDDTINPFLVVSNAGSGLCLACHIK